MSYEEYNDLYIKSQQNDNAKYLCISLDLVRSRELCGKDMLRHQLLMVKTMKNVITELRLIEALTKKSILLRDENIKLFQDKDYDKAVSYCHNPCVLSGDFYAFYIHNKSISEQQFIDIFTKCAMKNDLFFSYHYQSAKFDTTKYTEGKDKYYIGYCVAYLEHNKGNRVVTITKNCENEVDKNI